MASEGKGPTGALTACTYRPQFHRAVVSTSGWEAGSVQACMGNRCVKVCNPLRLHTHNTPRVHAVARSGLSIVARSRRTRGVRLILKSLLFTNLVQEARGSAPEMPSLDPHSFTIVLLCSLGKHGIICVHAGVCPPLSFQGAIPQFPIAARVALLIAFLREGRWLPGSHAYLRFA